LKGGDPGQLGGIRLFCCEKTPQLSDRTSLGGETTRGGVETRFFLPVVINGETGAQKRERAGLPHEGYRDKLKERHIVGCSLRVHPLEGASSVIHLKKK